MLFVNYQENYYISIENYKIVSKSVSTSQSPLTPNTVEMSWVPASFLTFRTRIRSSHLGSRTVNQAYLA